MPWVPLRDGQRLHVRIVGRGAPCVLVHGFASDSMSWLPFITPLLHRYRFIMPDLRGFGASRRVPLAVESRSGASALLNDSRSGASALLNDCPLTTYAHDLADVAGALALTNVPLVGISMGALTSVQCFHLGLGGRFARYMHIDQGLVICNSDGYAHGLLGGSQPGFFARMRRLVDALDPHVEAGYAQLAPDVLQQMASVFAEFTAAAFTRRSLQQAVYRLTNQPRLLRFFLPEEGFATHLQIMRAYLDNNYDLRDAFRAIEVPTTVLIGGASRMYPPEGQRSIGQYAPRARLCELPGVGHMLPLEAPRRFVRELHCFLSDTG